jgi:hypothetical protein
MVGAGHRHLVGIPGDSADCAASCFKGRKGYCEGHQKLFQPSRCNTSNVPRLVRSRFFVWLPIHAEIFEGLGLLAKTCPRTCFEAPGFMPSSLCTVVSWVDHHLPRDRAGLLH